MGPIGLDLQAGPIYSRGGFSRFGGGSYRTFGGFHTGPRFYTSSCYRSPFRSSYGYYSSRGCYPGSYGGFYGGYGYGGYYSRSYCPTPFPYYTPRIYVVPQPPRYYFGPPIRNVIVLPQPVSDIAAITVPTLPSGELEQVRAPERPAGPVSSEVAWRHLEEGKAKLALNAFADLAAGAPENGMYSAGYGLAAALAGDKITANYALRLAFETDPEGVDFAPIGENLKDVLAPLASQYRQSIDKNPKDLNLRFLQAALSHFLQDDLAAREDLVHSMALGDNTASASNLKKLIEKHLLAQPSVKEAANLL